MVSIPEISDIVSPALNIVVLQLLAYHISEYLGKTSTSQETWQNPLR